MVKYIESHSGWTAQTGTILPRDGGLSEVRSNLWLLLFINLSQVSHVYSS